MELPEEHPVKDEDINEQEDIELTDDELILSTALRVHVEEVQRLGKLRDESKTRTKRRYYDKKIQKLNEQMANAIYFHTHNTK